MRPFPFPLSSSPLNRFALALIVVLSSAAAARAQVQVDIALPRHSYILFEPIIATIVVINNSGRELELADVPGKQWLNVEVSGSGDRQLPPFDSNYKLSPLTVAVGQTVKRQIDLTPIFPIRELGDYRIRASVYVAQADRFFSSTFTSFDLTEGHVLWAQAVGNSKGDVRQISLLSHHLLDKMLLYVRVRDQDGPNVYTTQSIGRVLVSGAEPQTMLDIHNVLHVIHEAVPKGYYYTRVDTDGERVGQTVYTSEGRDRPRLVKSPSGEVTVKGGHLQNDVSTAAEAVSPTKGFNAPGQPKLSDRPQGLPSAERVPKP